MYGHCSNTQLHCEQISKGSDNTATRMDTATAHKYSEHSVLFDTIHQNFGDQGTHEETTLIQVSCVEKTVKATQRVTELYHAEVKVGQVQYISQEISARVIKK